MDRESERPAQQTARTGVDDPATILPQPPELTAEDTEFLRELGQQLRVDSIRCSTAAGSGHPTSSMSAADIIAVLLARHLVYDWSLPDNPNNDHLIYSKGHASPLCYSMFKAAGAITDQELLSFRKFGSRLEGHPTPAIPWVDVATGSLGQGLPIAVGGALAGKYLDKLPFHLWALCGDSELAERSVREAMRVGRGGHGVGWGGAGRGSRSCPWGQVPRQAAVPRLGALRRLRARGRLDLGGDRQGRLLPALQPDRNLRRQPARPAGRDRV